MVWYVYLEQIFFSTSFIIIGRPFVILLQLLIRSLYVAGFDIFKGFWGVTSHQISSRERIFFASREIYTCPSCDEKLLIDDNQLVLYQIDINVSLSRKIAWKWRKNIPEINKSKEMKQKTTNLHTF